MVAKNTNLTRMNKRESGIVHKILGGHGVTRRLEALGVRPGVPITKISSQLMRGPITIQLGNTQIALGFGIARKVIVKT